MKVTPEVLKDYVFGELNAADHRAVEAAIAADPKYSQAWLYLARVQRDLFQTEEAEKSFRKAIEIDPDYLEARAGFGGMLLDTGNVDESIRQLNAAVQRDP